MKLPHRRQFLHLAAGAAALPAVARVARGQSYPSRPVHWIVGYTPGGGNDIFARLMGQWLQERLGQPFVIENRPGAGSNIATEAVVNARPDGYAILLANFANASNASLYANLKFNFIRDIAPIAGIVRVPNICLSINLFQSKRSPNSLRTPKPIQARSAWPRPALAPPVIWPAN
jgi:tripartite-type tricarboxylate transporter receptor subunit TctC